MHYREIALKYKIDGAYLDCDFTIFVLNHIFEYCA